MGEAEPSAVVSLDPARIPRHIAIIMDGNGRWAKKRGLPRLAGHRAGTDNIRPLLEACVEFGIPIVTIYAFSTENWRRPADEVMGLMRLLSEVIGRETAALNRNGVRIRHLGTMEGVPDGLAKAIRAAVDTTRDNTRITLNVAFNYGGRAEIVAAIRRLVAEGVRPEEIDEKLVGDYLYTAGLPDPDLIIRTGGEMRLSNFLLWQSAYAEYYSTPVFWPDFSREELAKALHAYAQRERRFGAVKP